MIKWLFHRYIRRLERRYNDDASYMHELLDTSFSAFHRFIIMQMLGGNWRADAPPNAWHAAGIAGALVEDCGPCMQIASDMAMEAGMPGGILEALLSAKPTDPDAQLGFNYGRALLKGLPDLDKLRRKIESKWGKRALIAISLHVMSGRNYPVLKRALGHAQTCQRVRIGNADVPVNRTLKVA